MPTTAAAIIGSALLSAGSSAVQGSKARSSQRRVAAQRLENQKRIARKQSTQELAKITRERQSQQDASRLARASATSASGKSLAQRGIKARPLASFSDITRTVLDEGNVG